MLGNESHWLAREELYVSLPFLRLRFSEYTGSHFRINSWFIQRIYSPPPAVPVAHLTERMFCAKNRLVVLANAHSPNIS